MNHPNPLPLEIKATADSLRHVRQQVRFLLREHDSRVCGHPAAWVIAAHSEELESAQEVLAEKLSEPAR